MVKQLRAISRLRQLIGGFLLLILLLSFSVSWAEAAEMTYQTSLRNGTIQSDSAITFNYTLRFKKASGGIDYKLPAQVLLNGQPLKIYANTYRGNLIEGKNNIQVSYHNGKEYITDHYTYYLDGTPPYINVKGIYNYMMVEKRHIKFTVQVGDLLSVPEALVKRVYLNDKELIESNGYYQGLLESSSLNSKKQKVATEDDQPTLNTIRIETRDAIGNELVKNYNIIHCNRTITLPQLRYLIEKAPGLLPVVPRQSYESAYREVGVALDDSNKTLLGTYGGYVVLGHDTPIYNLPGDDLMVNGQWSDQGKPLTSIWVMSDTNGNHLPDDTWYYIDDSVQSLREIVNYKATYDLTNIGRYKDQKGVNKSISHTIPVTTPFTSAYFENAKNIHKKDFTSNTYSVYGNLNVLHDQPIEELAYGLQSYNLDDAKDMTGQAVPLDSVDFVKVYTNTLDLMKGVGSVMPAVNYVRVIGDNGRPLIYQPNVFDEKHLLMEQVSGDCIETTLEEPFLTVAFSKVQPLVDNQHVFQFPKEGAQIVQAFKREGDKIQFFYPFDRSSLSAKHLKTSSSSIDDFINQLTSQMVDLDWVSLMEKVHYTRNLLNLKKQLTTTQTGQLELLALELEKKWQDDIRLAFENLHNSYEGIQHLKWQTDFLSNQDFFSIEQFHRDNLENRLFQMMGIQQQTYYLNNTNGQQATIKAVEGLGYNMSKEEMERGILPILDIRSVLETSFSEGRASTQYAFYMNLRKNNHSMSGLYRPITYEMILAQPWNKDWKLYHEQEGVLEEIPIQSSDSQTIQFKTSDLGQFYIQ